MSLVTPAQPSLPLSALFPPHVAAAVSTGPNGAEALLPAEAQFLSAAAVPNRIQEFVGGRLCARLALSQLGILDFPIAMASDRRPVWPEGIVGSITHTNGYCAAVAARSEHVVGLGLDTERIGRVKPELWRRVCVREEISWLESLTQPQRELASTLIFCAKEAFYKCQYPLTFERLGFDDARVEMLDWDAAGGTFQVHATRTMVFSRYMSSPLAGRFAIHDALLTAGLAVRTRTRP